MRIERDGMPVFELFDFTGVGFLNWVEQEICVNRVNCLLHRWVIEQPEILRALGEIAVTGRYDGQTPTPAPPKSHESQERGTKILEALNRATADDTTDTSGQH